MNTKQVLVVRKDLNMRKGKIAAQCAHAAMSFMSKMGMAFHSPPYSFYRKYLHDGNVNENVDEINHWLGNSFRKICVYVNSEEELDEIHQKALDKGLISHMIIDNGETEFNGVLTKTVVAIGPHYDNKFEGITDNLPLL